jgi:hypothetical protein
MERKVTLKEVIGDLEKIANQYNLKINRVSDFKIARILLAKSKSNCLLFI